MKPFGILSILFLFCSGLAYAQTVTVKGKVFDNDLLPLPGAAIHVKDSEQGVVADNDGAFLIRVESGSVLVFSLCWAPTGGNACYKGGNAQHHTEKGRVIERGGAGWNQEAGQNRSGNPRSCGYY